MAPLLDIPIPCSRAENSSAAAQQSPSWMCLSSPDGASSPRNMPQALNRTTWGIDQFLLGKLLYQGKASSLFLARDKPSGLPVAIKCYHKRKLSTLNMRQVERELAIHLDLKHRNVIKLYACFEDQRTVYMVLEPAACDVFSKLRQSRTLDQPTCWSIVKQCLQACAYLHAKGIIHRDIKPENLLCNPMSDDLDVKLADFGLAIDAKKERPVTRLGTLDFMAPEVLRSPDKRMPEEYKDRTDLTYTKAVDVWSIGVLAFELLTGAAPFARKTRLETFDSILRSELVLPASIPAAAADFIKATLCKDAQSRPSAEQLLQHPWMTERPAPVQAPCAQEAVPVPGGEAAAPHPATPQPVASSEPADAGRTSAADSAVEPAGKALEATDAGACPATKKAESAAASQEMPPEEGAGVVPVLASKSSASAALAPGPAASATGMAALAPAPEPEASPPKTPLPPLQVAATAAAAAAAAAATTTAFKTGPMVQPSSRPASVQPLPLHLLSSLSNTGQDLIYGVQATNACTDTQQAPQYSPSTMHTSSQQASDALHQTPQGPGATAAPLLAPAAAAAAAAAALLKAAPGVTAPGPATLGSASQLPAPAATCSVPKLAADCTGLARAHSTFVAAAVPMVTTAEQAMWLCSPRDVELHCGTETGSISAPHNTTLPGAGPPGACSTGIESWAVTSLAADSASRLFMPVSSSKRSLAADSTEATAPPQAGAGTGQTSATTADSSPGPAPTSHARSHAHPAKAAAAFSAPLAIPNTSSCGGHASGSYAAGGSSPQSPRPPTGVLSDDPPAPATPYDAHYSRLRTSLDLGHIGQGVSKEAVARPWTTTSLDRSSRQDPALGQPHSTAPTNKQSGPAAALARIPVQQLWFSSNTSSSGSLASPTTAPGDTSPNGKGLLHAVCGDVTPPSSRDNAQAGPWATHAPAHPIAEGQPSTPRGSGACAVRHQQTHWQQVNEAHDASTSSNGSPVTQAGGFFAGLKLRPFAGRSGSGSDSASGMPLMPTSPRSAPSSFWLPFSRPQKAGAGVQAKPLAPKAAERCSVAAANKPRLRLGWDEPNPQPTDMHCYAGNAFTQSP